VRFASSRSGLPSRHIFLLLYRVPRMTIQNTCLYLIACRLVQVASLHLQSGYLNTGQKQGSITNAAPSPEEEFNNFLNTHDDIQDYAPTGSTGVMVDSVHGDYGPILVVYLTYQGATPTKTLSEVQGLFWDAPGFNDSLYHSSWHTAWISSSNVDFFTMESTEDPALWGLNLWSLYISVSSQPLYQAQASTRSYKHTMVIAPGSAFAATAYFPTTGAWNGWSQYYGNAITWNTMFHEVGHNWGLHHAGGYQSDGSFQQYLDDAVMGYQRAWRNSDPNAVARYRMGWLSGAEVEEFVRGSDHHTVNISALNEGPTGAPFLMVKIPCDECVGQSASVAGAGALYLSFRTADTPALYGIDDMGTISLYDKFTSAYLTLADRVHVHFQPDANMMTELWTTLAAGETLEIASATMWIHVCSIDAASHAKVSISDTSEALAQAGCPLSAPTPIPTPAPPTPATPAPTEGASSAVGDPHLQNVLGQRFDLMQPGTHVLLSIPRGSRAENTMLRVQADARQLGAHCSDMYFQEINITGSWAEAKKVGGYRYGVSQRTGETPEWIAFGKVELKVVHGRTHGGLQYLNVYVKHLGLAGCVVGGLLGEDDHTGVAQSPEWCHKRLALGTMRDSDGQGPFVASLAAAAFA